jgi:SWI/SNF-related matrix-associated actin-dependent regulator 1 of chromatin subfamily A
MEYLEIKNTSIKKNRETDKALLLETRGVKFWIPKCFYRNKTLSVPSDFNFTVTSGNDKFSMKAEKFASYLNCLKKKNLSSEHVEYIGAPEGVTPYPFQEEGAQWALSKKKAIIADEMGLGKTIQGLLVARSLRLKTLVVCPASVKSMWKIEAEKWAPDLDLEIISWAMLATYKVDDIKETFVIFDEAHYGKAGKKSKRGEAFLLISSLASRVLLLTGTPVLNRPSELYPLLKSVDSSLTNNWWDYMSTYCNAKKTRFGWDVSGASNLKLLHKNLERDMLRRERSLVLRDLPTKSRSIYNIEPCRELKKLIEREKSLVKGLKKARQLTGYTEAFAEIARVRASIANLKLPAAVEKCTELLEEREKVVVFWHHTGPLNSMKQHFEKQGIECVSITGDVVVRQRQSAVESFQNGSARLIFCTYGAACEGITLTSAHTSLMCECNWTPAKMLQAEDRTCRIGQKSNVEIYYLVVDNSLDAHVAITAKNKDEIIGIIVDGEQLKF